MELNSTFKESSFSEVCEWPRQDGSAIIKMSRFSSLFIGVNYCGVNYVVVSPFCMLLQMIRIFSVEDVVVANMRIFPPGLIFSLVWRSPGEIGKFLTEMSAAGIVLLSSRIDCLLNGLRSVIFSGLPGKSGLSWLEK